MLYATADKDTRQLIESCFHLAIDKALRPLEREIQVRGGKGGSERLGVDGLTFARFTHHTARTVDGQVEDMQLHQHVLVINGARGSDGKYRSLDSTKLYELKDQTEHIFYKELRRRLELNLRIRTEDDGKSFKLPDVPDEPCQYYSKRSHQVKDQKEVLQQKYPNLSPLELTQKAQKSNRSPKRDINSSELFAYWKKEAQEKFGFTAEQVLGDQ